MHLQTILVPTDYSDVSQAALRYAVALARDYNARLLVLHVEDALSPANATYREIVSERQPEGYRARLESVLRSFASAAADIQTEYLLCEGDPAGEVLRIAEEHRCDLIVLGSHGRDGWQRLWQGSTAENIERHAPCPVLFVRASMKPA